jgi:hypothetical protein
MAEVINGTSDQDLETLKERFAREYLDPLFRTSRPQYL